MRPFALLTYSIIALIIVGLAITLMVQYLPKEDIFREVRNSIDISQTPSNFGKTFYTGKLNMTKGLQITKTSLNQNNISLAVECNDPVICCSNGEECTKPVEWNYKIITFKQDRTVQVYTRCYPYFDEIVCRAYFGKMPAQATIKDIEYVDTGGKINSIVNVTNSGSTPLILGKNTLRVLKKVGEEWKDTENTYPSKEIDLLSPNQKHSFVWETNLLTGGEYKLEFKFEGENSGYDINGFDLVVGSNQVCERVPNVREIQDLNLTHSRILHFCTGCNYDYECLAKWMETNDGNIYEPYNKNSTYYIVQMAIDEICDCTKDKDPEDLDVFKDFSYETAASPWAIPTGSYYSGSKCNNWTNVTGTIE